MNAIVFPGEGLDSLRRRLLSTSPRESAAVLLAGVAREGGTKLLIREAISVPADAYSVQEELRLVIAPPFLAPLIKRSRIEGWSIILSHSHPFSDDAWFSDVDDHGEKLLMPSIFARAPARPHAALVLGRQGFDARLRHDPASHEEVETLTEVGRSVRVSQRHVHHEPLSERHDRSVRLFGAAGQRVLRRTKVAIVGLGGTGSIVAQQLAHLGIGELILLDPDIVDETSLNRIVGSRPSDVGRPKVDVLADLVKSINADVEVRAVRGSVLRSFDARVLLQADFMLCCTDSHGSRAVINQMAYQYLIPVIDLGIRIDAKGGQVEGISGRVQMLAPGLACLVCHGLLDPEAVRRDLLSEEERVRDPYIVGAHEPQPAVISLNGAVASLAVTMFLAAVIDLPLAVRHQVYLAQRGSVRPITSEPLDDCVVCSLRGSLARGDLWPLPWRTA